MAAARENRSDRVGRSANCGTVARMYFRLSRRPLDWLSTIEAERGTEVDVYRLRKGWERGDDLEE